MDQDKEYKINKSGVPAFAKCACGHSFAAHGSNGMMCAACPMSNRCYQFKEKEAA